MERFGPYELIEREEQMRTALRSAGLPDDRPLWEIAESLREHHEWQRRRLGLDHDRRRDAEPLRDALAGKNNVELERLAERSGTSRATLYRIRAGQRSVNPRTYDALAAELSLKRDAAAGEEWVDAFITTEPYSTEWWRALWTLVNEMALETMGVLPFDDLPAGFGSTPEIEAERERQRAEVEAERWPPKPITAARMRKYRYRHRPGGRAPTVERS